MTVTPLSEAKEVVKELKKVTKKVVVDKEVDYSLQLRSRCF
jgi:hypothetical protein